MSLSLLPIIENPATTSEHPDPAFATAPQQGTELADAAEMGRAGTFHLATLGCKVNQYESQYVRELLVANGYREAAAGEKATLAVVNTCTVTAQGDKKSRQLIRNFARDNPGVQIVVMGCYATAEPEFLRRLPGVAAVLTEKKDLAGSLRPFGVRRDIKGISRFDSHRRAFVKVQDGCILRCSFCIIPKVRPGLLSRPVDEVVAEVAGLVEAGYREIVLTGIHLGHYGVDLSLGKPQAAWSRLWHLLEKLANLPGEFRIRLSSLEATEVTENFVRVLADYSPKICPHLHLSLQSGSNRILKAMKRRYRIERFLEKCDALRQRLDQPAFTTDIIVGFPGETEADFQETLKAAEHAGFSKIHVFPFSARKGTEAASYSEQISPPILQDRRNRLLIADRELRLKYYDSLVGRTMDLLVESEDPDRPGKMRGTTCRYAASLLETVPALAGRLVPVIATRRQEEHLIVEPVLEG